MTQLMRKVIDPLVTSMGWSLLANSLQVAQHRDQELADRAQVHHTFGIDFDTIGFQLSYAKLGT